jgi:hypothetical protein
MNLFGSYKGLQWLFFLSP